MNQKPVIDADEPATQRKFVGYFGLAILAVTIFFSAFQLYQSGIGLMPAQNLRAIHLAFVLGLIFLLYPGDKNAAQHRPEHYDLLVALLAISGPLYLHYNFGTLVMRAGIETPLDLTMGALAIVLLLEATRRAIGPVLPVVAVAFLLYAHFGPYLPDLISHRGYSPERIVRHIFYTTEGMFGVPLAVASTFVFLFVLFGAIMNRTGISDYLTRISMAGLGQYRGGPAKSAVLASALMGSFSGSSTANVATTGTLTIPLMKRVGFRSHTAGGVEAAASTTGQFVPPVMGAAAFVMVEMTGIPYVQIIQAALLPAMLDLAGILFCVHMHAKKMRIDGMKKSELPPFWRTLFSQLHLLIPIIGLIGMLVVLQYSPTRSAYLAIPIAVLVSLVARNTIIVWRALRAQMQGGDPFEGIEEALEAERSSQAREAQAAREPARTWPKLVTRTWTDWGRDILMGMSEGARQALPITAACATAGIVIGVITLTGLGGRMQSILLTLSGGELWAALMFTAIGSIILGLGVPTTANYIIMATLMAPALVHLDVPLLAAHMFVFYFGILADTTPPVGLSAYVAAGIARAGPIRTSFEGFKFSITAFIIPFMFVYNPQLLLIGDFEWVEVGWLVASGLVGVYALSVMKEGWWLTRANAVERILMTLAALLLIQPSLAIDIAGFAVMGAVFCVQLLKRRHEGVHGEHEPTMASKLAMGGAVVAVAAIGLVMWVPVLSVTNEDQRWSRMLTPGSLVAVSHIHSVERTLVEDRYRVGWQAELIHSSTVTRSVGAGLPSDAVVSGGAMTRRGTGARFAELSTFFIPENEPILLIGDFRLPLMDYARNGRVTVRVQYAWEILLRRG